MIDPQNRYTKMQKEYYESTADLMAETDHEHHNKNPDYWNYLLFHVIDTNVWDGKKALDLGCGTGRNIMNLLKKTAHWSRVDGVDISKNNIDHVLARLKEEKWPKDKCNLYVSNGVDLSGIEDNTYDFIMSTIVLQHIAVHEIRYNLLKEVYRVLKPGGMISFQMGFGEGYGKAEYTENAYNAKGTNTVHDVIVRRPEQIQKDLDQIGFKSFDYCIRPSFSDGHPQWIFFTAKK